MRRQGSCREDAGEEAQELRHSGDEDKATDDEWMMEEQVQQKKTRQRPG